MGSLALWGAVAGAGEGWGKGIVMQAQADENEKDRMHNAKLAELQIKADNDRSLSEQTRADARAEMDDTTKREIAKLNAKVQYAGVEQRATAATQASADKRYDTDKDAASRVAAAKERAASTAGKSFTPVSAELETLVPGEGQKRVKTNLLIDNASQMAFFPDGDKLRPADLQPDNTYKPAPYKIYADGSQKGQQIIAPPQAIEDYINAGASDPLNRQRFFETFGYLPAVSAAE